MTQRAYATPVAFRQALAFEEHDTFLFGRLEKRLCCLLDDGQVSRL